MLEKIHQFNKKGLHLSFFIYLLLQMIGVIDDLFIQSDFDYMNLLNITSLICVFFVASILFFKFVVPMFISNNDEAEVHDDEDEGHDKPYTSNRKGRWGRD